MKPRCAEDPCEKMETAPRHQEFRGFARLLELANGVGHRPRQGDRCTWGCSLFTLPSALRWLWAPWIEAGASQRTWVLRGSLAMAFGFLLVAATLFFLPGNLPALLAAFVVLALAVSVIEISSYGFTVTALTRQQLDFFSGITTSFIRLGTLLAGTALLFAAGIVTQHHGVHHAWAWLFVGFAVAALAFYGYFRVFLPAPAIAQAVAREPVAYRVLLRGYFRQPHAFAVLGFLISYRVGEGFFDRMRLPFLLDPTAAGGLGLSLQEAAGLVPLGTLAIVVGGALGAGAIVRWGFNRVCPGIIPMDS